MTPSRYDGFLPGVHVIEGYGAGGFLFGGMSHRGSILALPSGVRAVPITQASEIDASVLAPLLAEPQGSVDLLVLGTGDNLALPSREVRAQLRAAGVGVDPMATHHAIATYNILLGEGRKVAALLLAGRLADEAS
ncbi:MAG: hypothetical protein JWN93_83 [Hyphomicrobiales bacterium]|nr:hypothetical protein [Hyphomicrobiales bacterium]